MIRAVEGPPASLPRRLEEQIAETALRQALVDACHPASWQGMARGLAWRLVSSGEFDAREVDSLSARVEQNLGTFIDDALWQLEQRVCETYWEYLDACPGDEPGALAAARLDAGEESLNLVFAACERAVEALRPARRRAA